VVKLYFQKARLPEGWADDVRVEIDGTGRIVKVESGSGADGAIRLDGACVPGVANLHSHAFQRAMAGLTEFAGPAGDSFWTWRERMYAFVRSVGPEEQEAIATQLYVEMLKAGYTAVAEFHYLHHDTDGQPYADTAEMAERVVAAADTVGIGLTLCPVLYAYGGFGAAPADEHQRRFLHDRKSYADLLATLQQRHGRRPGFRIGVAPHSLRAVTPDLLSGVLDDAGSIAPGCPIHIHVAEQQREVEACVDSSGRRPIDFLLDEFDIDRRWCLVHATHMESQEVAGVAASGAVAGICPTTEANLGDGIFPAFDYLGKGGRFGVGSDSHVTVDPADELRLLEYGQRLLRHERNLLAGGTGGSTGETLYLEAAGGGGQALGREAGAIVPGRLADLVVLDTEAPHLVGRDHDALLDSWIFAGPGRPVRHVIVAGRHIIRDGRHADEQRIFERFRAAMVRLADA